MALYDFDAQRLFVDAPLAEGGRLRLGRDQANYVLNVLRLRAGEPILVFNGRDGEWRAEVALEGRRDAALVLAERMRAQTPGGDLRYLFAPLKHARLDYMVQKAVEMGASRLTPVLTRRTQVQRVNLERMRANAIEAAEQCGILHLPDIDEPVRLDRLLADWTEGRRIVFCDEEAGLADPIATLRALATSERAPPLAVLIGPEGGFEEGERRMLLARADVSAISLGPRVLRADTAAVAALAIVQAALGDWRDSSQPSGGAL